MKFVPPPPPGKAPTPRIVGPRDWDNVAPEWAASQPRNDTFKQAIGVDLSYTEGGGDYASIVPVAHLGRLFYVRDRIRCRRDIIHLRPILTAVQARYPGVQMVSYIKGPEKAVLALLAEEHVDDRTGRVMPAVYILPMLARFPKIIRAQKTSEFWKDGRIPLAPNRPWTQEFVDKMKAFTGAEGGDDADVDALVSAIDYLRAQDPSESATTGSFQRTRT